MHSYTPFQETWWLEATSPGRWDAVEIEKGGQTIARLPYTVEEKHGARILTQPALTQSLGPWIQATDAGYSKTLSRENSLYEQLIAGLPEHDMFTQSCAPQITNWLPFYWAGFTQTTRYTYVLDVDRPIGEVKATLDKRNRRQLREASKEIVADVEDDVDTLLRLNDMTFARQGLAPNYSHDYVWRLDEAIQANAKRWIVIARDKESGQAEAGIYLFSHGSRIYSLLSGADPTVRNKNAGIVARWKAICLAHGHGEQLDFLGSMLKSVERRNRNYGATQVPYFALSSSNGVFEKGVKRANLLNAPRRTAWHIKKRALGMLKAKSN